MLRISQARRLSKIWSAPVTGIGRHDTLIMEGNFDPEELRRRLERHKAKEREAHRLRKEKDAQKEAANADEAAYNIRRSDQRLVVSIAASNQESRGPKLQLKGGTEDKSHARPSTLPATVSARSSEVPRPQGMARARTRSGTDPSRRPVKVALATLAQVHRQEMKGVPIQKSRQPKARSQNADKPSDASAVRHSSQKPVSADQLADTSRGYLKITRGKVDAPVLVEKETNTVAGYVPRSAASGLAKTATPDTKDRFRALNRLSILQPKNDQVRRELENCAVDRRAKKMTKITEDSPTSHVVDASEAQTKRGDWTNQGEDSGRSSLDEAIEDVESEDKVKLLRGGIYTNGDRHDWTQSDEYERSTFRGRMANLRILNRRPKEEDSGDSPGEEGLLKAPKTVRRKSSMLALFR